MVSEDSIIKFHWSFFCVLLTVSVLLLSVFIIYKTIIEFKSWPIAVMSGSFVLILVYCFLQCPISIIDSKEKIQLKLVSKTIDIFKDDILYIKPMAKCELNEAYRVWGSGGFFGFTGKFKSQKLGLFYMYATELDNLLLIVTKDKKIAVSCTEKLELNE